MMAQRLRVLCVNATTFAVLGAAVLSLQASFRGDAVAAVQLILMAVILDGLDGTIARRWGLASARGAQLDSLADLAAFGIAPGFLIATTHLASAPAVAAILAFGFCGAGAFRLARFNVENSQPCFSGVPITVAAAILTSLALPAFNVPPQWIAIAMVLLSALMVSRVEFYAGKSERQRYLVVPLIMTVALWIQVEIAALVIGVFFLCYAVLGVILFAQRWLEDRVALDSQAR
jgi:CDP-diacylglycerol---serine O-phosphatidyltransferase